MLLESLATAMYGLDLMDHLLKKWGNQSSFFPVAAPLPCMTIYKIPLDSWCITQDFITPRPELAFNGRGTQLNFFSRDLILLLERHCAYFAQLSLEMALLTLLS